MRRTGVLLASFLLALHPDRTAMALPPGFSDTIVHTGLAQPTAMVFAPDGRMIVGERGGTVRIVENGTLLPTPALALAVETFEEQGLLGLALHPGFPDSNWLYVCRTKATGRDENNFNVVSRFALHGNEADPGSEQVLIADIPTGRGFHVGGDIHFGPDGNLFVATGENGWRENHPQLEDRLEGKLLRLRPWGGPAPGNPLIGVPNAREEIWQKGLRNPFRFTIHPVSGQPYLSDVGEASFEEINTGGPGANFGWPSFEGQANPSPAWHANPWFSYPHSGSAALTGITFYTGTAFPPQFWHNLFFVDHTRGHIGRIVLNPDGSIQSATFPWGETSVSGWYQGPVSLVAGPDGALWYNTYDPGDIHRIAWTPPPGGSNVGSTLRAFDLAPPVPNPFRAGTTLVFSLAAAGRARLDVFDASGRRVRTLREGHFGAGPQALPWDGRDEAGNMVEAGVYFAKLETAAGTRSRRLAFTR